MYLVIQPRNNKFEKRLEIIKFVKSYEENKKFNTQHYENYSYMWLFIFYIYKNMHNKT